MNTIEYKGYHIDIETANPECFAIYDCSIGDYIDHDTIHSVSDAKVYIDKLTE